MHRFRKNVALKCGLNAAIVAEYIYAGDDDLEEIKVFGCSWVRCSARQIALENPFLTVDMVKHAIKRLKDEGIIRSLKLQKRGFDHTNWYSFTEYGLNLMEGGN